MLTLLIARFVGVTHRRCIHLSCFEGAATACLCVRVVGTPSRTVGNGFEDLKRAALDDISGQLLLPSVVGTGRLWLRVPGDPLNILH